MFHTFNMGLGIVLVIGREDVDAIASQLPEAKSVGRIISQTDHRRVIIG